MGQLTNNRKIGLNFNFSTMKRNVPVEGNEELSTLYAQKTRIIEENKKKAYEAETLMQELREGQNEIAPIKARIVEICSGIPVELGEYEVVEQYVEDDSGKHFVIVDLMDEAIANAKEAIVKIKSNQDLSKVAQSGIVTA